MSQDNMYNQFDSDDFSDFFDDEPAQPQAQQPRPQHQVQPGMQQRPMPGQPRPVQQNMQGQMQQRPIQQNINQGQSVVRQNIQKAPWDTHNESEVQGVQGVQGQPEVQEPSEKEKKAEAKKQAKLAKQRIKDQAKQQAQLEKQQAKEEVARAKQRDKILYIVIDKPVPGILNYLRESGLKVSKLFSDIGRAKNAVLMQDEPLRIVVIDTGVGAFTTTTMRKEMIDMLGMLDEENQISVFYTDSALKVDTLRTLGKSGKEIDWNQYKSTSIVAATILSYNENYKYDSMCDKDEHSESSDDILNFKGLTTGLQETPRMKISGFSGDAIINHLLNSEGDELVGYQVRL